VVEVITLEEEAAVEQPREAGRAGSDSDETRRWRKSRTKRTRTRGGTAGLFSFLYQRTSTPSPTSPSHE
jgi:hypothetical protein